MKYRNSSILIFLLFVFAFCERVFFDLGPNIELITMTLVVSSIYLNKEIGILLTFFILVMSDILIGNSMIFIFTWTGFIIPLILLQGTIKKHKILLGTLAGLGTNLFFYIWTNFGVWLIGNLYPSTIQGLMSSYINALPFLRLHLISTIIFVPLGLVSMEILHNFKTLFKIKTNMLESK